MKHLLRVAPFILVAVIYLLDTSCGKKHKNPVTGPKTYDLVAEVDSGIGGWPLTDTLQFFEGDTVNYIYWLQTGSSNLSVLLDGDSAPDSGRIVIYADHLLQATCEVKVKWKLGLDKAVYYSCPAIGDDGTIYVGTGIFMMTTSGSLWAVNPDGTVKWSYPLDYNAYSPVIGPDGTIYIEDSWNNAYAVTPSGTLKWRFNDFDNPDHVRYDVGQRVPAIGADGTVYVVADGLYALNPENGNRIWRFNPRVGGSCRQSPVIGADGTIYVTIHEDDFYAVNPDGTQKWHTHLDHDYEMSFTSPAIDVDGTIYLGAEGLTAEGYQYSWVYAFNPDSTLKWKYSVDGEYRQVRASPTIGSDGTIYIATKAGGDDFTAKIIALNPSTGTKKWEYVVQRVHTMTTADDVYSTPSIGADGLIYFGAETGYIYALNPNGTLNWKSQLEYGINWSSPAITADGTIYIGSMTGTSYQGNLYALRSSSMGYASSPWPRFRHDNKNTGRYGAN